MVFVNPLKLQPINIHRCIEDLIRRCPRMMAKETIMPLDFNGRFIGTHSSATLTAFGERGISPGLIRRPLSPNVITARREDTHG